MKLSNFETGMIILLFLLVLILAFAVYNLHKDSIECVSHSMSYTLNNLKKINNADISCTCFAHKPNVEPISFTTAIE